MNIKKSRIVSLCVALMFALGLSIPPKAEAFSGKQYYKLELCKFGNSELGTKCGEPDDNGSCDRTTSCTPDDSPSIM